MTTTGRMTRADQQTEQTRERDLLTAESIEGPTTERTLNDSLRRMIDTLRADAVYGSPIEREGVTVIPCSEFTTGFGMGGGFGFTPVAATAAQTEGAARPNNESRGAGFGGGGGGQGRPVAVVTISEGKARVLPVFDATKFMLAVLTTAGFAAYWITQSAVRAQAVRQLTARQRPPLRIFRLRRTPLRMAFTAAAVARAMRFAQRARRQRMVAQSARAMRAAQRAGRPRRPIGFARAMRNIQRPGAQALPTASARGLRLPAFRRRLVRA